MAAADVEMALGVSPRVSVAALPLTQHIFAGESNRRARRRNMKINNRAAMAAQRQYQWRIKGAGA